MSESNAFNNLFISKNPDLIDDAMVIIDQMFIEHLTMNQGNSYITMRFLSDNEKLMVTTNSIAKKICLIDELEIINKQLNNFEYQSSTDKIIAELLGKKMIKLINNTKCMDEVYSVIDNNIYVAYKFTYTLDIFDDTHLQIFKNVVKQGCEYIKSQFE